MGNLIIRSNEDGAKTAHAFYGSDRVIVHKALLADMEYYGKANTTCDDAGLIASTVRSNL